MNQRRSLTVTRMRMATGGIAVALVAGLALLVFLPSARLVAESAASSGSSSGSAMPAWVLIVALVGMIGAGIAGMRLLGPRE